MINCFHFWAGRRWLLLSWCLLGTRVRFCSRTRGGSGFWKLVTACFPCHLLCRMKNMSSPGRGDTGRATEAGRWVVLLNWCRHCRDSSGLRWGHNGHEVWGRLGMNCTKNWWALYLQHLFPFSKSFHSFKYFPCFWSGLSLQLLVRWGEKKKKKKKERADSISYPRPFSAFYQHDWFNYCIPGNSVWGSTYLPVSVFHFFLL